MVASVPELTSRTISMRRQQPDQQLGHFDFGFGRRAEGQAALRPPPAPPRTTSGWRGRGSAAPRSRRSRYSACRPRPRCRRPRRAAKNTRRAADGAERAHRRVDAAGDDLLGQLEQSLAWSSCGDIQRCGRGAGLEQPCKRLRSGKVSGTWNSAPITASASAPAARTGAAFAGVSPPIATSGTRQRLRAWPQHRQRGPRGARLYRRREEAPEGDDSPRPRPRTLARAPDRRSRRRRSTRALTEVGTGGRDRPVLESQVHSVGPALCPRISTSSLTMNNTPWSACTVRRAREPGLA